MQEFPYLLYPSRESFVMPKVVTANTLATGKVVFLGADGWVETVGEAHLYDDDADAEVGLERAAADAAKALIVEPFVADAGPERDGRPKMTLRDSIRAYGPTIDFLRTVKNA